MDVSVFFVLLGKGKGESEVLGGGGDGILLKTTGGGLRAGGGGGCRAGRVFAENLRGDGGAKFFGAEIPTKE